MTQHQMAEEEEEEEEEDEERVSQQQQEARQRGRVGITSMNILQFHEAVMWLRPRSRVSSYGVSACHASLSNI